MQVILCVQIFISDFRTPNVVHCYSIKPRFRLYFQWVFFFIDLWFFPGTPISSTNKTDSHNITEILLKVALNTINPFLLIDGSDNIKKK